MPALPDKLERLLGLIESVGDRQDRIQILIDLAARFRGVPEEVAGRPYPEANKTPACESEAYLFAVERPDGALDFRFAVENPQGISAKALAVILDDTLSGVPPAQVAAVSSEIVLRIFGNELSMGKNIGLMGMVSMVANSARRLLERSAG